MSAETDREKYTQLVKVRNGIQFTQSHLAFSDDLLPQNLPADLLDQGTISFIGELHDWIISARDAAIDAMDGVKAKIQELESNVIALIQLESDETQAVEMAVEESELVEWLDDQKLDGRDVATTFLTRVLQVLDFRGRDYFQCMACLDEALELTEPLRELKQKQEEAPRLTDNNVSLKKLLREQITTLDEELRKILPGEFFETEEMLREQIIEEQASSIAAALATISPGSNIQEFLETWNRLTLEDKRSLADGDHQGLANSVIIARVRGETPSIESERLARALQEAILRAKINPRELLWSHSNKLSE